MPADRYDVYHHPAWFGLTELQVVEHTDDSHTHHVFGLWGIPPGGSAPVHDGALAFGEGIRPEAPPAGAVYWTHRELSAEHSWLPALDVFTSVDELTRVTPETFGALEAAARPLRDGAGARRAVLLSEAKVRLGMEVVYEDVHLLYESEDPHADVLADRLLAGEGLPWPEAENPDAGYSVLDHREHYGLALVLLLKGRAPVCQGFDYLGVWQRTDGELLFARHGACRSCDMEVPFQWHQPEALTVLDDATWPDFRQAAHGVSGLASADKSAALVRVAGLLGRRVEAEDLLSPTEATDPEVREDAYRLWAAVQGDREIGEQFVDSFLTSEAREEREAGIRLAAHVGRERGEIDVSDLVERVEIGPR